MPRKVVELRGKLSPKKAGEDADEDERRNSATRKEQRSERVEERRKRDP